MKEPLISVIVPIYNVENYLDKCIESIVNQTYKNLEIILVDDGSPDNSPKICDNWALKDSRIKVIHKKNGGLSSARNAGIENASGKYLTFIDSDDYFDLHVISVMLENLAKYNVDISSISFKRVNNYEAPIINNENYDNLILSSEKLAINICQRKKTSVCGKLFKKEIFNDNKFLEGVLNEDFLFLSKLCLTTPFTICESSYLGYFYVYRESSITHNSLQTKKSLICAVNNCLNMQKLAKEKQSYLSSYFGGLGAYQASRVAIMYGKEILLDNGLYNLCLTTIRKNKKYLKKCKIRLKDRLYCLLFSIFPKFTIKTCSRIKK